MAEIGSGLSEYLRRWMRARQVAATLVAGLMVLAGLWLMTGILGAGEGVHDGVWWANPVGLSLWGGGQLVFIRLVADAVCPEAPIGVKAGARWLAMGAILMAVAWLTWVLVGGM